tara:strand:- start:44 stop:394 length:351 start_codon:yes stop_codon:yes gene_type:complete
MSLKGQHIATDDGSNNEVIYVKDLEYLLTENRVKALNFSDIYIRYKKPSERYNKADLNYKGIVAENVGNPESKRYRMVDGSHRASRLVKQHNRKRAYFYVITKKEFLNNVISQNHP